MSNLWGLYLILTYTFKMSFFDFLRLSIWSQWVHHCTRTWAPYSFYTINLLIINFLRLREIHVLHKTSLKVIETFLFVTWLSTTFFFFLKVFQYRDNSNKYFRHSIDEETEISHHGQKSENTFLGAMSRGFSFLSLKTLLLFPIGKNH